MADYTTITDAQVDPEAPITSELMSALRDNPIAIAEGAVGAPRIVADTFNGAVAGSTLLFSALGTNVTFSSGALSPNFIDVPGARFRAVTSGTVRVSFEYAASPSTGQNVTVQVTKNGTSVFSQSKTTATYTTHTVDVSYVAGDVINVRGQGGTTGGSEPTFNSAVIRNVQYLTSTTRLLGGT
jgi:hypothetical protein